MLKRVMLALLTLAVLTLLISSGVNSQICPEGMISYWKADGDASDSYGENDGTEYGNLDYTTGQVGQAFEFDGFWGGTWENATIVRILSPSNIPLYNSPWSLSMWVMIYEYPTDSIIGFIFDRGDKTGGTTRKMHRLAVGWYGSEDHLWNCFWGTAYDYDTGVVISLNTWYHIANTYDGTTARIYIDGVERWSKIIGTPLDVRDSDIFLGGAGCHLSKGKIDEVAMYDRPLTPEEILQHYENGLRGLGYCESYLVVTIDIKPGSDPNCFNNDGHGVIPVAILGSAVLDVTEIDAETVRLESMAAKAVGKSGKLLAHIEDVNADDYDDLVVQIEDEDGVFDPGEAIATVTGNLLDGTPFEGADTICIVGSSSPAPRLRTRPELTTTWAGIKSRH